MPKETMVLHFNPRPAQAEHRKPDVFGTRVIGSFGVSCMGGMKEKLADPLPVVPWRWHLQAAAVFLLQKCPVVRSCDPKISM
jgi:hypothetical protein